MLKEVYEYPINPWEFWYDTDSNYTHICGDDLVVYMLLGKLEFPTGSVKRTAGSVSEEVIHTSSVSEDLLLKAIAVAQNPDIIKDIT